MKHAQLIFLSLVLILALPIFIWAGEQPEAKDISLEGVAPEQVDSILAKLSDEQVRGLLLNELAKSLETAEGKIKPSGDIVNKATGLLHLLDTMKTEDEKAAGFLSSLGSLPVDFITAARVIGNGSLTGFALSLALVLAVLTVALLAEIFVRRFTANFSKQFQEKAVPELDGPMRFIAGIMRSVPVFIHILVFTATSVFLFYLLPSSSQAPMRYLFLMFLVVLVFYRILEQFSKITFSPHTPSLRILPVDDRTATTLHKAVLLLCTYTFSAIMLLALLTEVQLGKISFACTVIVAATLLIIMIISMILRARSSVRDFILRQSERNKTRNWIVEKFAEFWHIPAILYFTIIWMHLVGDEMAGIDGENSAFLLSLLVLPLFVLFDHVSQWVVRVSIKTLRIYNPDKAMEEEERAEAKEKERKLFVTASRFMRLAILVALFIWVLSLWGSTIPYATEISTAVFNSLITMALGLTAWRFASSYLEQKIEEATPEEEEQAEGDDEFGSASPRGRSYTLLPMLRKFIASTLLVMVTLIVLSSIGLDIGPLLAGAGVVGLAVGFGAQKLVSDVFTGFFYLLDDAFRVGEYIQAGSISGAVEAITLRNVMLRHHRGMLQIVPHSELGSITNFMRGGLVVKFNLEFPYDTDINKVRKIIKKVGIAMLNDEEFSKDFIQPVKSQGVKEIAGSVMIIRVKFTAQPGTQFVIQREAFRRITEALAANGIHYAHRKVIVELPQDEQESATPETIQKALEAGAAAELARQEEEKKNTAG